MGTRERYIDAIQQRLTEIDDIDMLKAVWIEAMMVAEKEIGPYRLLLQLLDQIQDDIPKIRQTLAFVKGKLG